MAGNDNMRDEGREPGERDGDAGNETGNEYGTTPEEMIEDAEVEPVPERLALDDDDRLPWLDADDDEYHDGAADSGRILGFVLLGLLALAALVGGIWWATHRTPDPALVADGSTIAAPGVPYKEAPKNPGGKTFEGTGNSAFAISEGQTRPARLGENAAATKAASDAAKAPGKAGTGTVTGSGSQAGASGAAAASSATAAAGPVVQVGAYSTRALAEAAWSRLTGRYSALSGQRYRVVEGQADIGTVYRLQAIPGNAGAANALCSRLKSAGLACQVKD